MSRPRSLRSSLFLVVSAWALGCASEPPPPPASPPPAPKAAGKPSCAPGEPTEPSDAKTKMSGFEGEVRRCFTLGTGKSEATVRIVVSVAASGEVREAKVEGDGHPSAVACLQQAMKTTRFATFCGPDVSIAWRYALR